MENLNKNITLIDDNVNNKEISLLKEKILQNNKKIEAIQMKELSEQKNFLGILGIIIISVLIPAVIGFIFSNSIEVAILAGIVVGFFFTIFQIIVWPETFSSKINEFRLKMLENKVNKIYNKLAHIEINQAEK